MKRLGRIVRNEDGVAVIEAAFALPVMIVMIWMFVQLAQVYRAMAGIQQALGQGARYATLCVNPTINGCSVPTVTQVKSQINSSVYGIGPGSFSIDDPVSGSSGGANYYDLKVRYTQPTSLLLFPGPTIVVSRSKRVWIASSTAS